MQVEFWSNEICLARSTHKTADKDQAVARAVKKHWGRQAQFCRESGSPVYSGQVMKPETGSGAVSHFAVTSRVVVRFDV